MKFKGYLYLVLIFLIFMISVSAASAADDAVDDVISTDINDAAITEVNNGNLDEPDMTDESAASKLSTAKEGEMLGDTGTKNFTELNNDINNDQSVIDLASNYTYADDDYGGGEGVTISRDVTINGHGYTIDGSGKTRIFTVSSGYTVVFNNINFINGYTTGYGGAILCWGTVTATSCNFTDNQAWDGGAMAYGTATSCNFTINHANVEGGAMYQGTATNSTFTGNHAYDGGAMAYGTATSCNFTDNHAEYGGAMAYGTATSCNFTGNQADRGGAMAWGTATSCNFTGNQADSDGGAMCDGTATSCNFTGNQAWDGGAMFWGTATSCNFTGNQAGYGGAMFYGYRVICTLGDGNDYYGTEPVDAYIAADDFSSTYNSGEKLKFNLTYTIDGKTYNLDGFTTTINVSQNGNTIGTYYALTGDDGGWLVDLNPGQYNATLSINHPDPDLKSKTIILNIGLAPTNISVECADEILLKVGNSTAIGAKLNPEVGELAYISSNETVAKVEDGKIIALNEGEANITIKYEGNEYYAPSNRTIHVIVERTETAITASDIIMNATETADIAASLNPDVGSLEYLSGDENIAIVDANGQITAKAGGETDIIIRYAGDKYYLPSNRTIHVTVQKYPTELTATSVSTTYNVNKDLVITLKDNNGKGMSGAKVSVDIDGAKEYVTDENGQIKVAVGSLVPKTYTAKISYAGDDIYSGSSTTAEIVVKKASPKLTASAKSFKYEDKTKKYTITLKDNKGNVLKNKKVTLKVNGKTYTATTNSKGVATFKLSKLTKKGTYSAVITYAGDKYYNKATKKAKITIKAPAWKTVSKGSKDKAMVKKIQKALKKNGYYLSYKGRYLKVDGIFHKYTQMAVKQFQKAKGLKVTGKVDYATAKKLKII